MTLTNWAGNITFGAARVHRPGTVDELRETVAASTRLRPLGTGHSFNRIADTDGDLVSVASLPPAVHIDAVAGEVTVSAGVRYGELASRLHAAGYAVHNLASLPHISVAGAVATGTHGSSDRSGSLSSLVRRLEVVTPGGELRTVSRGDVGFPGWVVALGALGTALAYVWFAVLIGRVGSTRGSVTSRPSSSTCPSSTVSSRLAQRSSVDLPDPEPPMRATTWCSATARSTPRSTTFSPNALTTPRMSRTAPLTADSPTAGAGGRVRRPHRPPVPTGRRAARTAGRRRRTA